MLFNGCRPADVIFFYLLVGTVVGAVVSLRWLFGRSPPGDSVWEEGCYIGLLNAPLRGPEIFGLTVILWPLCLYGLFRGDWWRTGGDPLKTGHEDNVMDRLAYGEELKWWDQEWKEQHIPGYKGPGR
jgi:hypothetical protein